MAAVDGSWCNIRKFIGSQLRKSSYRVKTSQCTRVPVPLLAPPPHQMSDEDETDLLPPDSCQDIPPELSLPPGPGVPCIPLHESSHTAPLLQGPAPTTDANNSQSCPPTPESPTGRPQRSRRLPPKYDDFMMY